MMRTAKVFSARSAGSLRGHISEEGIGGGTGGGRGAPFPTIADTGGGGGMPPQSKSLQQKL